MLNNKKIVVVLPAYNARKTLVKTYLEIPKDIVDEIIVVDDYSQDGTVDLARELGIKTYTHQCNLGYGANQKTCYTKAIEAGADIVVMLHPDYQYEPRLIGPMADLIASGVFDIVLGSRILCGGALRWGMPLYKYIANRLLTFIQNITLGQKLSEYHTGLRAFSKGVLLALPLLENSNDFIFDNEILVQSVYFGYKIGEISSPCRYTRESSSINFKRSIFYGLGVLLTSLKFLLQKLGIGHFNIFDPHGKKLFH